MHELAGKYHIFFLVFFSLFMNPIGQAGAQVAPLVGRDTPSTGQAPHSVGLERVLQSDNILPPPEPVREPATHGLFLGIKHGEIRGDLDAEALWNAFTFSSRLIRIGNGTLITGDYSEGGISNGKVEKAIANLRSRMMPGDKFILYVSAHGYDEPLGDETAETPGDEYLALNRGSHFTDDYLCSLLAGMDDIEKWVLIDACRSGGFWGTTGHEKGHDAGDLEKLKNISLFAAAMENEDSYANADGRGYFTLALLRILDSEDHLTFDTLRDAIQQCALEDGLEERPLYLRSLGDIIDLPVDSWVPAAFKSEHFTGSLSPY